MKNWKQFTFVAIIAIVGIIIGFMACDNNGNDTPTHEHKWGDWTVTTAPTCTTEGVKTRVCTLDATHTETQPIAIDPNAHLWGNWTVTTPATATADGVETRICEHNSAHKETNPIERTEPAKKDFTVNFLFQNPGAAEAPYQAKVIDRRTNCGSQNLEQLKVNDKNIVTIIEEAIQGAFNNKATSNIQRNGYRRIFGAEDGVTIYVENTATVYKLKATDNKTMFFHIDYLKSSPVDIQQNCFDANVAMDTNVLPYNAE